MKVKRQHIVMKFASTFKRQMKLQNALIVVFIVIVIAALHGLRGVEFLNWDSSTSKNNIIVVNSYNYVSDVVFHPPIAQWTVMLLRIEQISDFWSKPWSSYISGFGTPGFDYWLGLHKVYNMIQNENYKLRIEIQLQSDGQWYFVEYSSFAVVPEHSGGSYLLSVSGLSGDTAQLGDPLQSDLSQRTNYSSNGRLFSTFDYVSPTAPNFGCAEKNGGGWWFGHCCNFCPTCNQFSCYNCAGYPLWTATRLLIKSSS